MESDDVMRAFEEMALNDDVELPIDDALSGLAVVMFNPAISWEGEGGVITGWRDRLLVGLNERKIESVKIRVQ